ncbi:MarR family winged helix-turn-helix transcriptional regulator [Thermonema rossianum]|uniref:MarR family winged helix-turn-helix transcriptional regulator n=1 Tax=Thermonema rossianum TaxID=55505 RepID=UPI00056FFA95|nr:MarR family transcriptional regulator [Thermonema rossianum]
MNKSMQKEKRSIGLFFYLLDKMYNRTLAYELHFAPVDRHFHTLWLIHEHQNQISQQQLADLLKVDKAAMTRIVRDLERKGVIIRRENPHDGRSYWLSLTRKGEKTVQDALEAIDELHAEVFMGFSKEEEEQFLHMLKRIYQNLSMQPNSDVFLEFLEKQEQEKESA